MDILNIGFLLVGAGGVYVFTELLKKKNKAAALLLTAIKKKQVLAFLETDKSVFFRTIIKMHKNIGITNNREVVIMTKDSPKICPELGALIVHGDLYKGITIPGEVRKFFQGQLAAGWKPEDIGKFLQEIEQTPAEALKKYYKQIKETGVYPESIRIADVGTEEEKHGA